MLYLFSRPAGSNWFYQIIVSISRFEVEHRLGNLLQQIYRMVDQQFPVRREHLSLIIKDNEGLNENSFKIWKSAS